MHCSSALPWPPPLLVQPSDLYFRLRVDRCFYVGQLSGGARAEVRCGWTGADGTWWFGLVLPQASLSLMASVISGQAAASASSWELSPEPLPHSSCPQVLAGDAYRAAETDPLRTCAAALTRQMNEDRPEDMLRIRWAGGGGGCCLGDAWRVCGALA